MPEVVLWWFLIYYAIIPGVLHAVRNRFLDVQPLVVFIVGLGLIYSLTFGNVGLAYRQRAQLLPWLLVFAAVGAEQQLLRRQRAERARVAARPTHRRFPVISNATGAADRNKSASDLTSQEP